MESRTQSYKQNLSSKANYEFTKGCQKKSAQYRMIAIFTVLSTPSALVSIQTQAPLAIKAFIISTFIGIAVFCYYKSKKWAKAYVRHNSNPTE